MALYHTLGAGEMSMNGNTNINAIEGNQVFDKVLNMVQEGTQCYDETVT